MESSRKVASQWETKLISHESEMRSFATKLCLNTFVQPEDLVQQVFLKALRSQHIYVESGKMKSWLFILLKNELITILRRKRREVFVDNDILENLAESADFRQLEERDIDKSDFLLAAHFLVHLPQDQRDSLVAVKYLDLPYEEAARILGTKKGTVKSRVSRALETTKSMFGRSDVSLDYDFSVWQNLSKGIKAQDPYLQIAKAYEDISRFIQKSKPISRNDL